MKENWQKPVISKPLGDDHVNMVVSPPFIRRKAGNLFFGFSIYFPQKLLFSLTFAKFVINILLTHKHIKIMKKLIAIISALFLFSIVFTACDEDDAEDLADVTFNVEYSKDLNLVTEAKGGLKAGIDGTFSVQDTIDPFSSGDYDKYSDNIKEVKITEVKGEVTSINKDFTLVQTNLEVTSGYVAEWSFTDVAVTTGTTLSLDNANGQWDEVEKMLDQGTPIALFLYGETDEDDVEFTMKVTIKAEITANPL